MIHIKTTPTIPVINIAYRTLYVTKLATLQNFEVMFTKTNTVEKFYIRNHV